MAKISALTDLVTDRLPHALLITGHSIDFLIAQLPAFLKKLLCQQQSCDQCQHCLWINAKTHPDILFLPEQNSIKIDEIRHLIMHMQQSSHQGNYKIGILAPAEAMMRGASQALLKVLEEPPSQSLFILMSVVPNILPITIRSRCQHWHIDFATVSTLVDANLLALQNTLNDLRQNKLSPFNAAITWLNKCSLLEILTTSYLFTTRLINQNLIEEKPTQAFFFWLDKINLLRDQCLRKANLNTQITLEYLFWQWQKMFELKLP